MLKDLENMKEHINAEHGGNGIFCDFTHTKMDSNDFTEVSNIGSLTKKFRSRRWGSSLPGLRTQDPPLSPPST